MSHGEFHDRIREIVRDIAEETFPLPRWNVGDVVEHPQGYPVIVVSGELWREFEDGGQRLVNRWTWRRVDGAGHPFGDIESGEGWATDPAVSAPSFGH